MVSSGISWNTLTRLGGLAVAAALAGDAAAVTQYRAKRQPFLFDITSFTTSLSLPVTDRQETVRMSASTLARRLDAAGRDATVEPLSILLADDEAQITQMAERLAHAGREDALAAYWRATLATAKPLKKGSKVRTVEFDAAGFALVDQDAFADLYSKSHHRLTVDGGALWQNRPVRRELMRQLAYFMDRHERQALLARLKAGEAISVDQHLLPVFARKMVRKYITSRGPNCFHAALAFHSPKMTSSSLINIKNETGYHRAMVNYDELWRVINRNFYEVDPDRQALKYGDMLVFFDVPADVVDDLTFPVDYKWIRHTATYLFSGYTFSKGSKSPNTPYTVRTLPEEWKTWRGYAKNLGVKVFRRARKQVKTRPPLDLSDWIY